MLLSEPSLTLFSYFPESGLLWVASFSQVVTFLFLGWVYWDDYLGGRVRKHSSRACFGLEEGGYFVLRECGFVRLGFPGVAEGETWDKEVLVHVIGDSLLLLCHLLTSPTDTYKSTFNSYHAFFTIFPHNFTVSYVAD